MSTISASTTSTTAFKITTDTTGTLVFQTGASPTTAVTFDASQNVGVGVTPSAWGGSYKALQVNTVGSLGADTATVALGNNTYWNGSANKYLTSTFASLYYQNSGQHVWSTAGSGTAGNTISFTQAMTLDASGNLGVGAVPSAWTTSFGIKALMVGTRAALVGSNNNTNLSFNNYFDGTNVRYINNGFASYYLQDSSQHQWFIAPTGTAGAIATFTQAMTLDASGNLGVGTTAPNKAGVGKAISVSSTSYALLEANYNDARAGYLFSVAGGTFVGDTRAQPLIFTTTDAERARIDSSGNFLVGASSIPTGSSSFASGNSLYTGGNILIGNSGGTSTTFFRWDGYINSLYGLWNNGSTDTGVRLDSGSTSWAASSDERLKDIIEPITNATDKVSTLRAVIGKYKSDEPDKRRSFLIAQDVQAILPEAVSEGIAPNGTEAYLWLAYQDVIPLLVAAIKELNTRLEAVENK